MADHTHFINCKQGFFHSIKVHGGGGLVSKQNKKNKTARQFGIYCYGKNSYFKGRVCCGRMDKKKD